MHRLPARSAGRLLLSQSWPLPELRGPDAWRQARQTRWTSRTTPTRTGIKPSVAGRGFVDFNFAYSLPQVVRFRPEQRTKMGEDVVSFDWRAVAGRTYRYIFVRSKTLLPPDRFANDGCRVALVKHSGEWWLYERQECW